MQIILSRAHWTTRAQPPRTCICSTLPRALQIRYFLSKFLVPFNFGALCNSAVPLCFWSIYFYQLHWNLNRVHWYHVLHTFMQISANIVLINPIFGGILLWLWSISWFWRGFSVNARLLTSFLWKVLGLENASTMYFNICSTGLFDFPEIFTQTHAMVSLFRTKLALVRNLKA